MGWETFYAIVYLLGSLAELILLGILLARRQYRIFPVFTFYIAFNVFDDILVAVLSAQPDHTLSVRVAFFLLPLQYLLELGVLLEIAWRLLKPVRNSLPPDAGKVLILLVGAALAGGLLLAWHAGPYASGVYERVKIPLDLSVGVLRMFLFAVTAAFAQILGIGWKDKVLQLATGLSFYSAVDLVASLMQSHFGRSMTADHLKGGAYFVELVFFIWAFTTKDVERQEFSPQMQQFLVTLSARVRNTRAAIVRSQMK